MARVKRGFKARRRRNRVLKRAKGYFGRRKNCFTIATEAVDRAMKFAYRDRKVKKRDFRSLWITRINASLKAMGYRYSKFINELQNLDIQLDRKILANLATEHPQVFEKIVRETKA